MNLEKIAALLGQLQTILAVLDTLPDDCRKTVLGTLMANGLDAGLIARNTVKAKHSVLDIPKDNFESLVAISTTHLPASVREAIGNDLCHKWGIVLHPNEHGAFMAVVSGMKPDEGSPKSIVKVYGWALDRGIQWIKFDAVAREVACLPRYEDGETPLDESDVVLSA